MLLSASMQSILEQLRRQSIPADSRLTEEEQFIPATFAEETTSMIVVEGAEDSRTPVEVGRVGDQAAYTAFLDGTQRTVVWRRAPTMTGALVPIHVAHIAAGVMSRAEDGRLFMKPDLVTARLILLGPFEGLRRAGVDLSIPSEIMLDTDPGTFGFPVALNEWVVCDTTFPTTEEDRQEKCSGKDVLIEKALFNEGLVRSRAQGRVATLRQRLEFAVLARFRTKQLQEWVLVDGPLFFIDKWRRRAARILGSDLGDTNEGTFEDKLLYRAVGLIKTHRLRPKHPEQVMRIGPTGRSLVARLSDEVDIKGSRSTPDEVGPYGGAHLIWFTRLRHPAQPPYGLVGLIRLDVHRATFGLARVDELNPLNFGELRPLVDAITRGTWRERWPAIPRFGDYRSAAQPYPIQQVERVLKATAFPRRFLAYLSNEAGSVGA